MKKFILSLFAFFVGSAVIIYFGTLIKPYYNPSKDCGKRPLKDSQHLNNGSHINASVDVWPWQVSVLYRPNESVPFTQICEGLIVDKYWVMTTGTCTYLDKRNLLIRAGSTQLHVDDEFTQQSEVVRMIRHQKFNPVTLQYSVALLEVKTPFEFNDYVNRICVPDENIADHRYVSCHVTGYNTQPGDDFGVLHEAEVHLMSRTLCNKPKVWNYTVSADMLCVAKFDGDVDKCETQTNFGGPLNCYNDVLHSYYLIGIRVKTTSCEQPNKPMVYFKVFTLFYWLEHVMNISLH